MLFVTKAIDHLVWFVGYCFYRYDGKLRGQVEADLIERRALAAQKKAEIGAE